MPWPTERSRKGLPKNLDDVVVNNDKQNVKASRCTKNVKTCAALDAQDVLLCPKCAKRDIFAVFDDASCCLDGNVKHCNIGCQGTDTSPCSFCDSEGNKKTPTPKKKGSDFAEPTGFNIEEFKGEEDSPKKIPADVPLCKWCQLAPCILHNQESRDEGVWIVDNLNVKLNEGHHVPLRNHSVALCRMHARRLGHKGKGDRVVLPVCVQSHVDEHFAEKGEVRTGFKEACKQWHNCGRSSMSNC